MRKKLLILLLLSFSTYAWAQQFTQTISFLGIGEDSRLKGFGSELSMYGDYLVASAPEYINNNGLRRYDDIFYVFKHSNGSWAEVSKLEPPTGHTFDEATGQAIIGKDFIVIGRKPNGGDTDTSLAFLYQKQTDDSWQFHSMLPEINRTGISNVSMDFTGDHLALFVNSDSGYELIVFDVYGIDGTVDWGIRATLDLGTATSIKNQTGGPLGRGEIFKHKNEFSANGFTGPAIAMDNKSIVIGWDQSSVEYSYVTLNVNVYTYSSFSPREIQAGKLDVYELKGTAEIEHKQTLTHTGYDDFHQLGYQVGISGNTVFATMEGGPNSDRKVYVFEVESDGIWSQAKMLVPADLSGNHKYGDKILVRDNKAFVAAPGLTYTESSVNASGVVYAYERSAQGDWQEIQAIKGEVIPPKNGYAGVGPSGFGTGMAYTESLLLVGAPNTSNSYFNDAGRGEVYAFGSCEAKTYEVSESVCLDDGNYEFGGQYYSESGTYTHTFQSALGCDSTVMLSLTINPSDFVMLNDINLRVGNSIDFGGQTITETGEYELVLQNQYGCDSTIVQPVIVSNDDFVGLGDVEICEGTEYIFGDQTLTESGSYQLDLKNEIGGDSTVVVNLIVRETDLIVLDAVEICEGTNYQFGGQTITTSGDYEQLLTNQYGCDSLVTVNVKVNTPDFVILDDENLCEGAIYQFGETEITQTGMYQLFLKNQANCDSTVQVQVNFHSPDVVNLNTVDICEGETFTLGTQLLNASGDYQAILINQYGCDSTVNVSLNVLNKPNPSITLDESDTDEPTLKAEPENATYQWIDCATGQAIAGATGITFKPTVFGDYAVDVTVNGCTQRSQCFSLQVLSAEDEIEISNRISVFPNPAEDMFKVEMPAVYRKIKATIYNTQGIVQSTATFNNRQAFELSLASLPQGIYTLRIIADENRGTKRIFKQ